MFNGTHSTKCKNYTLGKILPKTCGLSYNPQVKKLVELQKFSKSQLNHKSTYWTL